MSFLCPSSCHGLHKHLLPMCLKHISSGPASGPLHSLWRKRFLISVFLAPSCLPMAPFHRGPCAFLPGIKFWPPSLYPLYFSIALIAMIPCIFCLWLPNWNVFPCFVLHCEPWFVPDNKHCINAHRGVLTLFITTSLWSFLYYSIRCCNGENQLA